MICLTGLSFLHLGHLILIIQKDKEAKSKPIVIPKIRAVIIRAVIVFYS